MARKHFGKLAAGERVSVEVQQRCDFTRVADQLRLSDGDWSDTGEAGAVHLAGKISSFGVRR